MVCLGKLLLLALKTASLFVTLGIFLVVAVCGAVVAVAVAAVFGAWLL